MLIAAHKARYAPLVSLLWVIAGDGASQSCSAETLVFTDSTHPLTNIGNARIVLLDAPIKLEAELSVGLPADPKVSAEIVQHRMYGNAGENFMQRMRLAQQGVADAWSMKVEKLPAVIVDGMWVTYGIANVSRAESEIYAYQQTDRR